MSTADRIKVLIAHRNPLVSAGLQAAFAVQRDFDVASADAARVQALGEECLDRVKVVVTDCDKRTFTAWFQFEHGLLGGVSEMQTRFEHLDRH